MKVRDVVVTTMRFGYVVVSYTTGKSFCAVEPTENVPVKRSATSKHTNRSDIPPMVTRSRASYSPVAVTQRSLGHEKEADFRESVDSQLVLLSILSLHRRAHAGSPSDRGGPPPPEKYDEGSPGTRTSACKRRTVFRSNGGLVSPNGRYTFVQHNGENALFSC